MALCDRLALWCARHAVATIRASLSEQKISPLSSSSLIILRAVQVRIE